MAHFPKKTLGPEVERLRERESFKSKKERVLSQREREKCITVSPRTSATRWLDYFFNIWSFTIMKFALYNSKLLDKFLNYLVRPMYLVPHCYPLELQKFEVVWLAQSSLS